jgi:hypothetical protein
MAETLLALVSGHLLADFIIQTEWMVRNKRKLWVMLLHITSVIAITAVLLGTWNWPVLLTILGTHLLMDAIKAHLLKDTFHAFAVDQAFHIAVLIALAYLIPDAAAAGWWSTAPPNLYAAYCAALSLICGTIVSLVVGGIIIHLLTKPMLDGFDKVIEGLPKGGLYIGWLERALVMLLILINQPTGVGFLVAAKSILRFGEVTNAEQRKAVEYIIIGTFMSFGWGLLIAILTQRVSSHWVSMIHQIF